MPTLTARAKLTLSLRIVGQRADGYHLLDAEMVTVDLADSIEIDESGDSLDVLDAAGRPLPELTGPSNLVARALRLVGRTAGVRIRKHIPMGAGLGGGSADAAAVMRWAGHDDLDEAVSIGADVPFCLRGGRARVQGIGEDVTALDYERRRYTLLTPPIRCPTAEVYRAWDDLGGPVGTNGNDLEAAALAVAPELARWRERLADATGSRPRLAGSGSTWYVDGSHAGPGRMVVQTTPPY